MDATFALRLAASSTAAMEISSTSIVAARRDLLCSDLPDGAVILDLVSGVYYTLDSMGTFIWQMIQDRSTVQSVIDAVLAQYAVDRDRCEHDVLKLFNEMKVHKLIEVDNDAAA